MANPTEPYQDALVDPEDTARVAQVYAQNGPQAPTFQPPSFLSNAVSTLSSYGQSPDAVSRNAPPAPQVGMYPQGFNPRAIPPGAGQQMVDFGAPGSPFAFEGSNQGIAGQAGYDIAKRISEVPVLGGALNYATNTVARGPLLTGLGMNPDVNAAAAQPGADLKQIQRDYWNNAMSNAAMGAVGALEGAAGKATLAGRLARGAQGADQSGIAAKLIQGSGAALTKDAGRALTDAEAAAAGKIPTGDVSGAAEALAAKRGQVTTAEGGVADAGLLTRAIQTAAGSEGVALSQHPIFAPYGARGKFGPANVRAHGGDIGTATRAVMSGDADALALLGDDLSNQLIQNKVAHLIRQTGAPEDVIRRGLGATIASDGAKAANVAPADIVKAGEALTPPPATSIAEQNVNAVREAIAQPSADVVPGDAPPINGTREEQRAWLDKRLADRYAAEHPAGGGAGEGGGGSTTTATPEPPKSPAQSTKEVAQTLASQAMYLFTDAQRAALVVGHLPLLRQALPLMADAVARGQPQEIAFALGRTVNGLVSEGRFNQMNQGFASSLESAGVQGGERLLTQMHGPVGATEEFGLRSILGNVPVIANLNRMYPAMLNSLRSGAALQLAEMQKLSLGRVNSDAVIDAVNELSGRGGSPADSRTAEALSAVFFGPKLLASTWQVPIKAIQSAGRIAGTIPGNARDFVLSDGALKGKPIDPVDLFRVRSLAAYVAAGAGLMRLGNAFGLQIVTDPNDRDWGRMILPGGSRIDLWSGFGTEARLIAQEWNTFQQHDLAPNLGGAGRPRGPFDDTMFDLGARYLRGKLNPGLATVVGDYVFGKTMTGEAPSLKPLIPQAPLSIEAGLTSDPGNEPTVKGQPAAPGAPQFDFTKALLAEAGASVISTTRKTVYDGLGAAMGEPTFGSGSILKAYSDLALASQGGVVKWHSGDPVMAPPSTVIGSGTNAIQLDPITAERYIHAVGQAREAVLGPVVNSQEFQSAGDSRKQSMFDTAVQKADRDATTRFLASDITHETDPKVVVAEAVDNFIKQDNYKDKAYWVATLDRAGKLTPDVKAAIDSLKDTPPGEKAPITAEEFRRAAPLVHEYLAHVPFGTDGRPFGTPDDWVAVDAARQRQLAREDELTRGGVNPSLARAQAELETVRTLPPLQAQILRNGALLENPARRLLAQKYGSTLTRFLGTKPNTYQESDSAYSSFLSSP